ncbi:unnamed protein product [Bursaphelenchus okinawaensis]|uniref:Uncharacterized protein n=1 Tax=Bursaphelenchus okinawaensis TaxID=465554 RepID=A0A811K1U9_9BILA|nr:unnamed protein product [Bursaphelenchus okinawaensis]CAG9088967.1 unnamed protein product [Bursaphelenchus okinawaensis]
MSGLKQRRVVEGIHGSDHSNKALSSMISSISSINNADLPQGENEQHIEDIKSTEKTVEATKNVTEGLSLTVPEEPKPPIGYFAAFKEMFTTDFVGICKKGE